MNKVRADFFFFMFANKMISLFDKKKEKGKTLSENSTLLNDMFFLYTHSPFNYMSNLTFNRKTL